MDKNTRNVILVVIMIILGVWGYTEFKQTPPTTTTTIPTTGEPVGTEFSKFSFPLYATDTRTATASMTVTVWYDNDKDGKMDSNELRSCSDSSGTYTTLAEYPIGTEFDIWVQAYGSSYQTSYTKVHMTGHRNSDGSAKALDTDVFILTQDDSVTYDGLINGKTWDDSTDYNYTTDGTTGLAQASVVLSAADKGLSSRIWEDVDYKYIYSDLMDINDYDEEFWIKWDEITSTGISSSSVQAPDFFCVYMTIQDKIDLNPSVTDFDIYFDDDTNYYLLSYVSSDWGDLIYNTADSAAPRPTIDFSVGTITAAGTTVATYGVAVWTGCTYEQMVTGTWTKSATYYLGTPGNDWDWGA